MFAKCVVTQSPYDAPDITEALRAFSKYINLHFDGYSVMSFTYNELSELLSDSILEKIPAVKSLNDSVKSREGTSYEDTHGDPDYDFIDLGALSRNIFFGICRDDINDS